MTQPDQRNEDGRGASPAGDTRDKLTITFLTRTPVEGEQWQPDDARKRAGVGLKLRSNMVSGAHIVVAVLRNSPAERCGLIEKGDELISVDGESMEGKGMDQVARHLLGEEGTTISLTLKRNKRIYILAMVMSRFVFCYHVLQRLVVSVAGMTLEEIRAGSPLRH